MDEANKNEDVKGIPSFWLTIFKNVEMLAEMVQEADEPVLESLTDITVTFSEKDPMGFTLHFHFAPNQFFTNSVLTKCYEMKCEPPEDDPFSFEVSYPANETENILFKPNITGSRDLQVHRLSNRLAKGEELDGEAGEEEAEAQEQGEREDDHQAGQGRQLLQLLRPARCS